MSGGNIIAKALLATAPTSAIRSSRLGILRARIATKRDKERKKTEWKLKISALLWYYKVDYYYDNNNFTDFWQALKHMMNTGKQNLSHYHKWRNTCSLAHR